MIFSPRALQTAALSAFAVATLAVAGCGGGSSSTPAVTPTATPTATASGNGNGNGSTPTFTFTNTGGTANITAGASGGGTLTSGAAVGGVTNSSTWGANTATGATIAMTAQLATGVGDITPTSFPLFTVATAVDNNNVALTGAYTAIDYLKITATPATVFSLTPGVVVSGASVTGKTSCSLFSLGGTTAAPKWQQAITTTSLSPTITFTAQNLGAGNTVNVGNDAASSSAILALACK